MFWQRLGKGLFFAGIVLLASETLITGAVIGGSSTGGLTGLVFLLVGALIISMTLEEKVEHVPITELTTRITSGQPEPALLILDTSMIFEYPFSDLQRLVEKFPRERVHIPQRVLDEVHDERTKEYLCTHATIDRVHDKDLQAARKILDTSPKNLMYEVIAGNRKPSSREEAVALKGLGERVLRHYISDHPGSPLPTQVELALYARKHCQTSDADAAVVALARIHAREGRNVVVGERDADIEYGVKDVEGVRCVNPYVR